MGSHHLLGVAFRFEEENIALWQEDATEQPEAGRQDGKNLDGHHEFALCAEVSWDEGNPHDEENQHAESHTLGLTGTQHWTCA